MKQYLPTMLALLFLFVFVFSVAATVAVDLAAKSYTCGECCSIPATGKCTAGSGRMINGKCECRILICPAIDPPCTYKCPVCE